MSSFVWQRCLDVPDNDATGYHDNTRSDLIEALTFVPRTALDIGCGAGATGAYLKKKHPETKVWGIELNKAAADIAATRLDKVISGKFEEINLEAEGIAKGSLDLVLCADVLEHLYNPWQVLVDLKEYLSEQGRIVISIPNIRYLPLLDDLARGYWRYAEMGILDITHLRFFTLKDLQRFIFETGYVMDQLTYGRDPTLTPLFESHRQNLPCTIDTGKLVLRDVGEEELNELCSGQFFVTIKCGTPQLAGYERPNMGCFFWQGQQTEYLKLLAEHQLTPHEAECFDQRLAELASPPRFDLLVVCGRDKTDQLTATIQSIAKQLYPHFRITVLGDGAAPAPLQNHSRIEWIDTGGQYWSKIPALLDATDAQWGIILEAGDQLPPHALLYAAENALRQTDSVVIYVDEDRLDAAGRPEAPYFKPDFRPDYFFAHSYIGDGFFFRTDALRQVGGFRTRFGSPIRDLLLRLFAEYGSSGFSHVPDVLFHRHSKRSLPRQLSSEDDGRASLEEFVRATGITAAVLPGLLPGSHQISPRLSHSPSVMWITEAPASIEETKRLVETEYFGRSYAPLSLTIFASPSAPPEVLTYLEAADSAGVEGLNIFVSDPNVSLVRRLDAAIRQSDAALVLLLRPDSQPAAKSWLSELVAEVMQKDIGAVAPRLLSPQGRLIGNAILLGCGGIACGFGHGDSHTAFGHFGRQLVKQNPSALSTDALVFSRQTYLDVAGFDLELNETAAAIDFSLRLVKSGKRLLWTPHISIVCTGDDLKKLAPEDEIPLLQRWLPAIARDPSYNVNLSRATPFALIEKPQVSKLRLPWKPLPRVMAFPADNMGCGHYRVIEPFNAAVHAGLIDGYLGWDHYNQYDLSIFEADTLLLQRQVTDSQLEFLRTYRQFFKMKLIYELDDLITNLPVESFHRKDMPKDIAKRLREGLQVCDRFIVSTEPLADAYRKYIGDIRVVPNRIDIGKWGHLEPVRKAGSKPRVGWAGGLSHAGDLAIIVDVVKELADEVDWIFLGMCPDTIRPYVKEYHFGVPTPQYPAKLASLNLDLAIAPIAHNDFNECKSNLKLLEYGILGYPVIASDFGPYRGDFPVELVKNRARDWVRAIREHVADLDSCATRGDLLRKHVLSGWILQDNVESWRSAWLDF